ncbi:hypothetical protein BCR34DRAFT_568869 [Clohesyomyces aquaticus]|uniref:Uncharacterized protein n=1 Tax=Clohesyomyces aquaticus TaxID=1231657 RepID=A0A1Y1ZFW0_9PLEO|nr:hypothetical protein BCR34DRAFT_568869 [Clohesyomyces aquaticus]
MDCFLGLLSRIDIPSLYGPGVVAAWCLTFLSVGVSWTLNHTLRRQDTLSAKLVFTLFYPVIALYHSIQEVDNGVANALGPDKLDGFWTSPVLISSLSIYEIFAMTAPILLLVSESRDHVRRASAIFFVAVMGFFVKAALLTVSPQVPFNTLRPAIFSELWGIVGLIMVGILVWYSWTGVSRKVDGEESNDQSVCSKTVHLVVFYLAYAWLGTWGIWEYPEEEYPAFSSLLFMAEARSITSCSQALALGAGAMALGSTMYAAVHTRHCRWNSDVEGQMPWADEGGPKEKTRF